MKRLLLPIVLLAFALPALAARFGNAFVPRLLLDRGEVSRQYEVERFNNATDACNFYGASQTPCTLATEFFSGVTGPVGDLRWSHDSPAKAPGRTFTAVARSRCSRRPRW